jgi:uncharacterized membrane protein
MSQQLDNRRGNALQQNGHTCQTQMVAPLIPPPSPLVVRQLLEVEVAKGGGRVGPGPTVAAAVCVAATQRVRTYQGNHLPAGSERGGNGGGGGGAGCSVSVHIHMCVMGEMGGVRKL